MSTQLTVIAITEDALHNNQQHDNAPFVELNEVFLFSVITNKELLTNCLTPSEINLIQPNWGVIELQPTTALQGEKRTQYLQLLRETIQTNSSQKLDQFLYQHGITSPLLSDRAKAPEHIKKVITKIAVHLAKQKLAQDKFTTEIQVLMNFLQQRIDKKEQILWEFSD